MRHLYVAKTHINMSKVSTKIAELIDTVNKNIDDFGYSEKISLVTEAEMSITTSVALDDRQKELIKIEIQKTFDEKYGENGIRVEDLEYRGQFN